MLLIGAAGFAQATKTEVLYFKAYPVCCQARSCNALESYIEEVVARHFKNKSVVFRDVRLYDPENASLIEHYKAKSQTVVIVSTLNGKTSAIDVTHYVRRYAKSGNKQEFEKDFLEAIRKNLYLVWTGNKN